MSDVAYACARWLTLALLALLPLIVWPGLPQPFSIPKLQVLAVTTILLILLTGVGRATRRVRDLSDLDPQRRLQLRIVRLAVLWILSWMVSTFVGGLAQGLTVGVAFVTVLFAIMAVSAESNPARMATAMVIGATLLASIVLAQAFGADPFALFGWAPPIEHASPRLRVYGTLGNPDFVAALLTATTPLTVGVLVRLRQRGRWMLGAALLLQLAAIIATGSRAGALGLFTAAMTWAAMAQGHRRARIIIAATGGAIAAIAIIVSTARPLGQTIAGRAYIVSIAAPHAFDAPIFGHGPGAFEVLYDEWDREARLGHRGRPPFAGPQQHAHNDYLEALIDRGLLGLVTIVVILATSLRNAWRLTRRTHDASVVLGAAAMLTALAAIACVDFPFERPTELSWFWSGVAMIILSHSGDADGTLNENAHVGPDGPDDRAGPRHDRRGDPGR